MRTKGGRGERANEKMRGCKKGEKKERKGEEGECLMPLRHLLFLRWLLGIL